MSKFYALLLLCCSITIVSCGPSAEEKAAAEKKVQDSIAAANVQMEAAMEAARQQLVEDSLAMADTTAKADSTK